MAAPRDVVLLGSTGSIGTQAIDVITRNPDRFRVVGVAASGNRADELAAQVIALDVDVVAITQARFVEDVQLAIYAHAKSQGFDRGEFDMPRILAGPNAATEIAAWPCDVVVNGMSGAAGLMPTLAALEAGRTVALANKESLIIGGDVVKRIAKPDQIVPVDSEHSALAQSLRSGRHDEVKRLILTASGGPFRGKTRAELADVTPEDALKHPTWNMGPLVTINSATLMNKGLEVIEAHLLFDIDYDDIAVVVHPQSIVHSMVEFTDGSTIAQASPPDMRLPIALGLSWPDRLDDISPPCDWTQATRWDFEPLDEDVFGAVRLARAAGAAGGTAPAVFNAADEECVAAFLAGAIGFLDIVDTVEKVVEQHVGSADFIPGNKITAEDVLAIDAWARQRARSLTRWEPAHA